MVNTGAVLAAIMHGSRTMSQPEQDVVTRARRFAEAAHGGIDHRRKHTHEPYTVHLERVATLVASVSDDVEMVAAAWLHDVVEDTPATPAEVERVFGASIAALVGALTDVDKTAGNRRERKALDRARLAASGARAQTVKYADIIDNTPDICAHDPHFAPVYVAECAALLKVMRDGDPRLRGAAEDALRECRKRLRLPRSQRSDLRAK